MFLDVDKLYAATLDSNPDRKAYQPRQNTDTPGKPSDPIICLVHIHDCCVVLLIIERLFCVQFLRVQ